MFRVMVWLARNKLPLSFFRGAAARQAILCPLSSGHYSAAGPWPHPISRSGPARQGVRVPKPPGSQGEMV